MQQFQHNIIELCCTTWNTVFFQFYARIYISVVLSTLVWQIYGQQWRLQENKNKNILNFSLQHPLFLWPIYTHNLLVSFFSFRHSKVHEAEETKVKEHCCTHCSFQTRIPGHLKRHLRTHTGEKPYKCPHCDYSCNTSVLINCYHYFDQITSYFKKIQTHFRKICVNMLWLLKNTREDIYTNANIVKTMLKS